MQEIEALTFSLGTVMEIVALVAAGVTSWAYLKKNFELNTSRISHIETQLNAHGKSMTAAVTHIGATLDNIRDEIHEQRTDIVRVVGRHELIDQRVKVLEAHGT